MTKSPIAVDVCVATRRRPDLLRRLLTALGRQQTPAWLRFRVIVVDNDAERSAGPAIEAARAAGLDILDDVEPERNISLARNRAWGLSGPDTDFVASIDDDCIPPPEWLWTLVEAVDSLQADVVLGPVHRILPMDAPAHIRDSGVFEDYNPPTGATEWLVFSTANALVRRSVAMAQTGPFRPDLGLTGGEDTDFFQRLALAGAAIVWCREAGVEETVAADRLRIGWIAPRSFRAGSTYFEVFRRWTLKSHWPLPQRLLWFAGWCCLRFASIAGHAFGGLFRAKHRARATVLLKDLAFNAGIAARSVGVTFRPRHS